MSKDNINKGKKIEGVVVSNAMDKTAVVKVARFVKDDKYKKFYKVSKKVKAHDENNTAQVGDKVVLAETRPISKDKHFTIVAK
jgi:small subunit ribosomal protein S17